MVLCHLSCASVQVSREATAWTAHTWDWPVQLTGSRHGGGLFANPASPTERTCSWLTHISRPSHTRGPPNTALLGPPLCWPCCPLTGAVPSSAWRTLLRCLGCRGGPCACPRELRREGGGHRPTDPQARGCPWQIPPSISGPWCPCPAPGQALKATGARPSFCPSPGSSGGPAGLALAPDFWSQTAPPPLPCWLCCCPGCTWWPLDPDCLHWGQLGHIRGNAVPDPGQSTRWVLGPASLRTNQATLRYSPTSPSNGRGTAYFLGLWN